MPGDNKKVTNTYALPQKRKVDNAKISVKASTTLTFFSGLVNPFIDYHHCGVYTARLLKYVWSFFNIIHEVIKVDLP